MKTIDNDIKTGEFKKAYLLYGKEGYLIRQYRDKLKNALVAPDDTMNYSYFEGKDFEQTAIIDLAETLPFFDIYLSRHLLSHVLDQHMYLQVVVEHQLPFLN